MDRNDLRANAERFSGFAQAYDAHRPQAPPALGVVLSGYCGRTRPDVVDLGSGTGLSSRWVAGWAATVVGVEPSDDMRHVAAQTARAPTAAPIEYGAGYAHDTGLENSSADVVVAVQAMHWMEPRSTLDEVRRLLRPGGVFAAIDADWPPVTGVVGAEVAWAAAHGRMRVLEARLAAGFTGDDLREPIRADDPVLVDEDLRDPHRNRTLPGGVRSWSKREHLDRMVASGLFAYTRELVFDGPVTDLVGASPAAVADRVVDLMSSQGSYHGLRRAGLPDADIGIDRFEHDVRVAYSALTAGAVPRLSFSWRVRIGIVPA